jgi:hypothetical protein
MNYMHANDPRPTIKQSKKQRFPTHLSNKNGE